MTFWSNIGYYITLDLISNSLLSLQGTKNLALSKIIPYTLETKGFFSATFMVLL